MRSVELSTLATYLLRKDLLTVARLRKEIKARAPVKIDVRDLSGFSVLHLIFSNAPTRWLALASELLKNHGASPNTADLDGMTPLMVAAANGATKGVELLLKHGAGASLSWTGSFPSSPLSPTCPSSPKPTQSVHVGRRASRGFQSARAERGGVGRAPHVPALSGQVHRPALGGALPPDRRRQAAAQIRGDGGGRGRWRRRGGGSCVAAARGGRRSRSASPE